ncbi:MAG: choice-of-anchor Q domain-containing protein [Syntrophobacteraceae bacterium]
MKRGALQLISLFCLLFGLTFIFSSTVLAIVYVKPAPDGSDANSGMSWAAAKASVNGAIAVAAAGDEIWVMAGAYHEHVRNRIVGDTAVDVAVYGGFAGVETSRDRRDSSANSTILHGDYSGTTVAISGGAGSATRVDGFLIVGGNPSGVSISGSAPVIANNIISSNQGPGITISKYKILQISPPLAAHPVVTGNTIVDNEAVDGGGIVVVGDILTNLVPPPPSAPQITHNVIARNTAFMNGGGIGCWGHTAPLIAYNLILANSASTYEPGWDGDDPIGPWMVGGGGIFATARDMSGAPVEYAISAPTIINNMVAVNGGLLGGGICLIDYKLLSPENNPPAVVTNNTVVANNGAGIFYGNTFPTIRNNLVAYNTWGIEQDRLSTAVLGYNNVFGNTVQGNTWNYKGITDQTGINGNISADPKLANYMVGDLHLQPGSACIDAGSSDAVGVGWTDFEGRSRVIGSGVDIGADESDGTSRQVPVPVIHVRSSGDDARDGLNWANAKRSVAGGIRAAAMTGGEVWVKKGTYHEHIKIPPFVYLYGGFSGAETVRANRNPAANPTILDGSGIPTVVHVKNAGYLVCAFDGFTVQNGGVYRGKVVPGATDGVEGRGGGLRSRVSSLYIANNIIRRNSFGNPFDTANKRGNGAGIHLYQSHSILMGNEVSENEILNTFDGRGAGLFCNFSMPLLRGNTISSNAAVYGSGIYSILSIPRIIGNIIENNAMYDTYPLPLYFGSTYGAITLESGEDFLIEGNRIRGNTAAFGAGIFVTSQLAGRIQNNLVINNRAYDPTANGGMGGGIYCLVNPDATDNIYMVNNTIVGNTATYDLLSIEEGGGIAITLPFLPPRDPSSPGKLVMANNIVAFNSSGLFLPPVSLKPTLLNNDFFNIGPNYTNVSAGASDISQDPLFVDRNGPDDILSTAEDNDYHLTSSSPCIDKGSATHSFLPATDFWGNPRVADGDNNGSAIVDMGVHEYPMLPGRKIDSILDFLLLRE